MMESPQTSGLGTGEFTASYQRVSKASSDEDGLPITIAPKEHSPILPQLSTRNKTSGRRRQFSIRAIVTIIGSLAYTASFATIVFVYLRHTGINGIVKPYTIDARIVSYYWFITSVFALNWARVGLAGFEAAGLDSRILAPRTALKFMWHADKSWSMLTGWVKVAYALMTHLGKRDTEYKSRTLDCYPGLLWWTLAVINVPLWIAVPLSGLSFNLGHSLRLSGEPVSIDGVNDTNFDLRSASLLWQSATSRWSQGTPTVPKHPTIFYAPQGTEDVSETFYDEAVNAYQDADRLTFFLGPDVNQRVEGQAWGLEVKVGCQIVNPRRDLTLVKVKNMGDYEPTGAAAVGYLTGGPIYGCSNAVLGATNFDSVQLADYAYLPGAFHNGLLEAVIWQYYNTSPSVVDPTMNDMRENVAVVAEPFPIDISSSLPNPDILAYGLSLSINSSVGFASLSAEQRTYCNFTQSPSSPILTNTTYGIPYDPNYNATACTADDPAVFNKYCNETADLAHQNEMQNAQQGLQETEALLKEGAGVIVLENLILASLTCLMPKSYMEKSTSVRAPCMDFWNVANLATGGKPYSALSSTIVQSPAISPERMRLAILKLVGEMAIAMMGPGTEPFEGGLTGVKPINILVPGVISWKYILALLVLWSTLLTASTCLFFSKRDRVATLDGYQIFRYGAEWKDEMEDCADGDFQHCEALGKIPSSGELTAASTEGRYGFVGVTQGRRRDRTRFPS